MAATASNTCLSALASRLGLSHSLVACNIYVTAGSRPHHAPSLIRLLENAQQMCRLADADDERHLRWSKRKPFAASSADASDSAVTLITKRPRIVHAFCDPVYNRSSLHVAGTAPQVVVVASQMALQAHQELLFLLEQEEQQERIRGDVHKNDTTRCYPHPTVGLVDHIAVMPLLLNQNERENDQETKSILDESTSLHETSNDMLFEPSTASGWTALHIGRALQNCKDLQEKVQVLYYGGAHPQGTPLAQVRREQTAFFQSARTIDEPDKRAAAAAAKFHHPTSTTVVVGASPRFVENWNVRLAHCSRTTARSLTTYLRTRCCGTVEALTLPYANQQWEVACNLLHPSATSSDAVDDHVKEWLTLQQQAETTAHNNEPRVQWVTSYRVGTTQDQCLKVLIDNDSDQTRDDEHEQQVMDQFLRYLRLNV